MYTLTRDDIRSHRGPLWPVDERVPPALVALGDAGSLRNRLLAVLCSVRRHDEIHAAAEDAIRSLGQARVPVVGGFHSPLEKKCLEVMLSGEGPVVICLGRRLPGSRLPAVWKAPIEDGRLLVLSAFEQRSGRLTAETAYARNRLVCALSDGLFVPFASPGGHTEALCRDVITWGRPIFTLDSPLNQALISLGARAASPGSLVADIARVRLTST